MKENTSIKNKISLFNGQGEKAVKSFHPFLCKRLFCQEKYYSPTSLISITSITPAYSAAKPSEEGP